MFTEDELLPISALQHLIFCERQWALIHLERIWEENRLTVEGRHLHERTDTPETEVRGDLRIARGLQLRSLRLGLTGRADVVEFHRLSDSEALSIPDRKVGQPDAPLPGGSGFWLPKPIEYKRGQPKTDLSDKVQLCAQALCLEEMLNVAIPSGALYYGKNRRRHEVAFDEMLRNETEAVVGRLHELSRIGRTPQARYEKKCDSCSLFDFCLPKVTGVPRSAQTYLDRALENLLEGGET